MSPTMVMPATASTRQNAETRVDGQSYYHHHFEPPPPPQQQHHHHQQQQQQQNNATPGRWARASMPLPSSVSGGGAREDAARRGIFMYTYLAHAPRTIDGGDGNGNGNGMARDEDDRSGNWIAPDYHHQAESGGTTTIRPPPPLQTRSVNIPVRGSGPEFRSWPRPTAHHRRHFSASASLPSETWENHDSVLLLNAPPNHHSVMAGPTAMMHSSGPLYHQQQQGFAQDGPYSQTLPYQKQSREDFMARTDRAVTRARIRHEPDVVHQQQNPGNHQPQPRSQQQYQQQPPHYQHQHQHQNQNQNQHHQPQFRRQPPLQPQLRQQQDGPQHGYEQHLQQRFPPHHQQPEQQQHQQHQQQQQNNKTSQNQPYHNDHHSQEQQLPLDRPPYPFPAHHRPHPRQTSPPQNPPYSQNQPVPNRVDPAKPAMEIRALAKRMPDGPPRPVAYNFPRRISSANTPSNSTREKSLDSRLRSPSWGSQISVESFHSAQSSPHTLNMEQASAWARQAMKPRQRRQPGELFAALPGEVLEMILDDLKQSHLSPGSASCATCWMRDACSVALTARKWLKFARTALYEDIQIIGVDSPVHKKKYKGIASPRLVLLRRSLRANPVIAAIVRSLKVPSTAQLQTEEAYQDLVATVVMSCTNLERVVGFYPAYNHSFGRYFQALSTRQRLKEMNWIVQPSPFQRQQRVRKTNNNDGPTTRNLITTPGDLQPQQTFQWLENHSDWRYLTSLTVHCAPGATLTPGSLLVDTVALLPALHTLYLSGLPHNAFNDEGLLSLPPLKKLSLVNLGGVTSSGLSSFATRWNSRSLVSLSLVHCDIKWLPALARVFSNLASLENLSFVQSFAPVLPSDEVIWLFPYLASTSLKTMHWDVVPGQTQASAADSILARSIQAKGFPALGRLRAPADPEGLFQSVCRPQERYDLPSDRFRPGKAGPRRSTGDKHSRTGSQASTASSQNSIESSGSKKSSPSPTSPRFPDVQGTTTTTTRAPPASSETQLYSDLHQARLAAQARQEAARQAPRFLVNVFDEDDTVVDRFGLAGYMGDIASGIRYELLPDDGTVDEKGGLVDVVDLLADGGEDLTGASTLALAKMAANGGAKDAAAQTRRDRAKEKDKNEETFRLREGCQGRWNYGAIGDKKDKERERWPHIERGRWRGVVLS